MSKFQLNRRSLIKSGVAVGAGLALPTIFTSSARAYNEPTGDTVTSASTFRSPALC
jgi:branched-chain amino acid transport system substrate-binding protein